MKKNPNMYDAASELYNKLLQINFGEQYFFPGAKRKKMDPKYDSINSTLYTFDYTEWFKEEDREPADIPPSNHLKVMKKK